jgi:hypothetical protein
VIKIRLQGLPEDVEAAAAVLRAAGNVLEESSDYANRGTSQYVRRYMDVQFDADVAIHITITRGADPLALPPSIITITRKDISHGR